MQFEKVTYRVVWVADISVRDPSTGKYLGEREYESWHSTREDAVAALAEVAEYDERLMRWVPNDPALYYASGNISRKEFRINDK